MVNYSLENVMQPDLHYALVRGKKRLAVKDNDGRGLGDKFLIWLVQLAIYVTGIGRCPPGPHNF
jgi:hypothetical protein